MLQLNTIVQLSLHQEARNITESGPYLIENKRKNKEVGHQPV